ncbi:hypothetical protein GCM10010498_53020 [Streptomyces cavourensis]|nr:hypothetical protein GCM10010498_53020 [Streptomyces cavourensis]
MEGDASASSAWIRRAVSSARGERAVVVGRERHAPEAVAEEGGLTAAVPGQPGLVRGGLAVPEEVEVAGGGGRHARPFGASVIMSSGDALPPLPGSRRGLRRSARRRP